MQRLREIYPNKPLSGLVRKAQETLPEDRRRHKQTIYTAHSMGVLQRQIDEGLALWPLLQEHGAQQAQEAAQAIEASQASIAPESIPTIEHIQPIITGTSAAPPAFNALAPSLQSFAMTMATAMQGLFEAQAQELITRVADHLAANLSQSLAQAISQQVQETVKASAHATLESHLGPLTSSTPSTPPASTPEPTEFEPKQVLAIDIVGVVGHHQDELKRALNGYGKWTDVRFFDSASQTHGQQFRDYVIFNGKDIPIGVAGRVHKEARQVLTMLVSGSGPLADRIKRLHKEIAAKAYR